MDVARVILDIPTQALDDAYTYLIPDGMDEAQVGCAVSVPFGNRAAIGFIVGVDHLDEEAADQLPFDPRKIKPLYQVVSSPYFNEDGAACAQYLANRYVAPLSNCVRLFTPPGGVPRAVNRGRGWQIEPPTVGEVDDRWVKLGPAAEGFKPRTGAVKQQAILDALQHGDLRVAELSMEFGAVGQTLKSLASKNVVVVERRRRLRGIGQLDASAEQVEYCIMGERPEVTPAQGQALAAIDAALDAHDGHVVVVDGVTGSGKTEVYLRAIERVVSQRQTALVLVPEISLTPQTVARFRGRFGDSVAVMHSRMSQGERYDQWDFIRSGRARVVVGARSALFTPLRDLGIIVIDEEHEGSYKQDQAPRYQARDVAAWIAQRCGATLVLGSATPSIETLHQCETDARWTRTVLAERVNGRPMPEIDVVDMSAEFRGGSRSMFSRKLSNALQETLVNGQKAILLLNQRGFAKFLLCRDCGYVPECPNCSTALTYHEKGALLMCHHCDYRQPAPPRCPECGSPYLKKFGAGTQRVEAALRELLDSFEGVDAQIIRMDADTTKGKGAHQRLLEEFMAADSAVLLGTQMIAKGLDFADVTLVGVINADTMLKLPDFRAGERTFDLIEQVAGRAGRAELPGRVIVQTYQPDSVSIQAAAHYDRQLFLDDELRKRQMLKYPPFVRLANILVWGKDEPAVRKEALALSEGIRQAIRDQVGDAWTLFPATPCVLARLRGTYRWHITVKCPAGDDLAAVLGPFFKKRKPAKEVSVAVDIDPLSLL